ncbi:energy transducer TonB [Kangiella sp.]|uniref:energy transducer TonB n=1 Tax=Kangiella sp. TaxID=1920245 RepID=UPI003A94C341
MKIISASVLALIVTCALILLMSQLITSNAEVPQRESVVQLTETPLPPEKTRTNRRPPEPQPPAVAPSAGDALPLRPSTVDTRELPTVDMPPVEIAFEGSPIGAFSAPELVQSNSAMPLYQAQPNYPMIAASQGIEGWVLLQYDVDTSGTLSNIKVVDAQPRRTFDREAVAALKKWKFKPAMDNGQPMSVKGQTVKIEFNLEKD